MPEEETWLTLRISKSLRDWVKGQAKADHRTMSGYVIAQLEREREKKARRESRREVTA